MYLNVNFEGASLVGESMGGFPKGNYLGFQQPLPLNSIPTGFLSHELGGLTFLALESWAGGPSVGLGLLAPKISLTNLYPHGCGASLFRVCAPPTSQGRCGFFNSVVVRLPFTGISDIPE